jgi:DNA-binding CsgD family transcriptional regulator
MDKQKVSQCVTRIKIKISDRERICVCYLLRGMSAREIGETIFRSQRTVEDHIANLKRKFNCRTKSELINKLWDHFFPFNKNGSIVFEETCEL